MYPKTVKTYYPSQWLPKQANVCIVVICSPAQGDAVTAGKRMSRYRSSYRSIRIVVHSTVHRRLSMPFPLQDRECIPCHQFLLEAPDITGRSGVDLQGVDRMSL